jgi:hypothetical protein
LASTDAAEKLTSESIPSAAAAFKGKERDACESQDNGVVEGRRINVFQWSSRNVV